MMFWLVTGGVLAVVLAWAWWLDHRRRGSNGVVRSADDIQRRVEITEGKVSGYSSPSARNLGNGRF
ncbi:MAG: hypothetical protein JWR52_3636 [Marmoricola sp.]|nr:hypothetical protein [Marmoricola sp.]